MYTGLKHITGKAVALTPERIDLLFNAGLEIIIAQFGIQPGELKKRFPVLQFEYHGGIIAMTGRPAGREVHGQSRARIPELPGKNHGGRTQNPNGE